MFYLKDLIINNLHFLMTATIRLWSIASYYSKRKNVYSILESKIKKQQ